MADGDFDAITEARRQWDERSLAEPRTMEAATAVVRAQQLVATEVDRALRPLGLTFARYEVLMLLLFSQRGRLPLGKIGERLQVHAASVTNAIDRLEGDGLVERVPNPQDRRGTLARITPKGKRLAEKATGQLNDLVFAGVAPDERLVEVLKQIRHDAGDF